MRLPVAPASRRRSVAPVERSIAEEDDGRTVTGLRHDRSACRRPAGASGRRLLVVLRTVPSVVSSIFPAAAPTVAAAVAPRSFRPSAVAARFGPAHPGGIASPGAKNTGRKLRRAVVVTTSRSLYAANARLDSDRDRIACEVVRKRQHKR